MMAATLSDWDLGKRPMRIAAGGMLTLAALFSAVVAIGYIVGLPFEIRLGGMLGGGSAAFSESGSSVVELIGGTFVLGHVILVGGAVIFLGAVSVFASLYPRVIYVACVVAIVCGLLGVWLTTFGLPHASSIVAGGLGFISGLRIQFGFEDVAEGRLRPAPRGIGDWLAVGAILAGLVLVIFMLCAS